MATIVPVFFCKSLEETLKFYRAIGFTVTYEQHEPYAYGAVQYDGVDLHFTRADKNNGASMALIHVDAVAVPYQLMADGLRAHFGSIPTANHPRITRMRGDATRFTVYDPDQNMLTFINVDEPDYDYTKYKEPTSDLERVLDNVIFLRDTYHNDASAAKVLDKAILRNTDETPLMRARAIAARAELAVALGESERLAELRAALAEIQLDAGDREQYAAELGAAERLEKWKQEAGQTL